ncbi:MAG: tRNA 2-thiouridine(34) synthase MnmA [Candidatus Omnitrophica bacterium]|nr:tRNA 2-thiouridine(34) synthase MnmA [Candidatus Omnitrophota bacterium]
MEYPMGKKKILVAMSGGVDSSVTAALLKYDGHEVSGATMRTWSLEKCALGQKQGCCGIGGVQDAREVADRLGISHWVFNFEDEFKNQVMDDFAEEYREGRTPNPCISCNERIKFKLFLTRARQLGFEAIATGHYAQVDYSHQRQSYFIREGRDASKDQSYVLYSLDQEILSHLVLPIGKFTKKEIRATAKTWNLPVWTKPDSQEICFVPDQDYARFLMEEYGIASSKKGVIRTKDGKVVGEHDGYFRFTRGQRRGLRVPFGQRIYVVETNPETNEVIVGTKQEVLNQVCLVSQVKWFLRPDFDKEVRAHVKIRYLHSKALASLNDAGNGSVRVVFDKPQEAITKGQSAVFYEDDQVIGGGRIEEFWD